MKSYILFKPNNLIIPIKFYLKPTKNISSNHKTVFYLHKSYHNSFKIKHFIYGKLKFLRSNMNFKKRLSANYLKIIKTNLRIPWSFQHKYFLNKAIIFIFQHIIFFLKHIIFSPIRLP